LVSADANVKLKVNNNVNPPDKSSSEQ